MKRNKAEAEWKMQTKKEEKIAQAAAVFYSRWTWQHLERVDPELAARFKRRQVAWMEAKDSVEIEEIGDELARGWKTLAERMEKEDNSMAYLVCRTRDGILVALAEPDTVIPPGHVWFSPDEIGRLIGDTQVGRTMLEVKRVVAKAELTKVTKVANG